MSARKFLCCPMFCAMRAGSVVSYFEWVQGLAELFWGED